MPGRHRDRPPRGEIVGAPGPFFPHPLLDVRRQGGDPILTGVSSRRSGYGMEGSRNIIGGSAVMRVLMERVRLLARSDIPVLIEGESGTGKELVARALHGTGDRRDRPFLAINCGGLADGLLESELFGYHRGAFTGAHGEKPGLFEVAHRGTLFLDEVADLSPRAQTRLLRVLQEGEVFRLGGTGAKRVDVRVLSATHKRLEDEVRAGGFREDLFYRLRVVSVRVPPLRERREDILSLVGHFLERHGRGSVPSVDPKAMDLLVGYPWPGNVRELENEIRRALTLLGEGRVIHPGLLSIRILSDSHGPLTGSSLRERMSRYEAVVIRETLDEYGWNKTRAAVALGVSRQSLIRKVARYGLGHVPPAESRARAARAAAPWRGNPDE